MLRSHLEVSVASAAGDLSKVHIGLQSLPKGSLPRPIGTLRGYCGPIRDYWGLSGLIGLGRLPLGRLLIPI